ncbi:methyltransferase [Actinomadura sp. NBRC 104425]|uniref:methyltransferase domain-containing protein n=1 Tax=Actinomadura sp. NBRC 104425 TaxID=3032204 RepID=UPI0024A3BBF3|nr:methyltransferase domain-containing protein [Actinomadura sp. NBRC 104425]GLZ12582.1 methyltransferase [Actinomadura sp. NBRC 104425]
MSIDALIARLDAYDADPSAVRLRTRSYELLGDPAGLVADVGCGAGLAVAELAERGVQAVGVDVSEQMIELARRRRSGADFRIGGACDLPFGDGELAGYRADKVFHELADPTRALAEARRVLMPGGRIVLVGQDWDTFVIDSSAPELTRRIVHARADQITSPRAARAHRSLLLDAGFQDVAVEVHTAVFTGQRAEPMLGMLTAAAEAACTSGVVTRAEADGWLAEQRDRVRSDRFLLAVPMFVAAATRPPSRTA